MVEIDAGVNDNDRPTDLEKQAVAASSVADGGAPDLDEFLRVLSNRRRRCALYGLVGDDIYDLDVLAKHVTARLEGTSPDEVDEDRHEEVKVTLVHADIPMLEEIGVISYDRRTGDLCLDYPPSPIERLLEACATLDEYADADELNGSDESDKASSSDR